MKRKLQQQQVKSRAAKKPKLSTIPPGGINSVAAVDKNDDCEVSEALKCQICYEYMHTPLQIECGHSFCGSCLDKWHRDNNNCPLCRRLITRKPMHNSALEKFITNFFTEEADKNDLATRKKMHETKKNELAKNFEEKINSATAQTSNFINTQRFWAEAEKIEFKRLLIRLDSAEISIFLGRIGFDENFIYGANRGSLEYFSGIFGLKIGDLDMMRINLLGHIKVLTRGIKYVTNSDFFY